MINNKLYKIIKNQYKEALQLKSEIYYTVKNLHVTYT